MELAKINCHRQAEKNKNCIIYSNIYEQCRVLVRFEHSMTTFDTCKLFNPEPVMVLSSQSGKENFPDFSAKLARDYMRASIMSSNIRILCDMHGQVRRLYDTICMIYQTRSGCKSWWGNNIAILSTTKKNALSIGFNGRPFISNYDTEVVLQ